MSKGKRLTLRLYSEFSQQELDDKRDRISGAMLEYDDVEAEKKESNKEFSEAMKGLRGEMRSLAKAIKRRGEDRDIDCLAKFHDPQIGFKTIVRLDTGEIVKTEPMTDDERQDNLFEEVDELERMYRTEVNEPGADSPHEHRDPEASGPFPPPSDQPGGETQDGAAQ
jgi:hypothetical protein